jgi:hypothetical protein
MDSIRASGVSYVILCSPMMKSAGKKLKQESTSASTGHRQDFLSYEDAAVAMVRAMDKDFESAKQYM